MKKKLHYCLILLFLCFVSLVDAQNVNRHVESLLSLIDVESYAIHFDSLRTDKNSDRKVRQGASQSIDHDACRDYIYRQFVHYFGDSLVYVHYFDKGTYKGLANVAGFKPGTNPDAGIWIVGAHYDSNNNFSEYDSLDIAPGANDNGTGLAAVLEIARVLSGIESEASVLFAAWDFEERFTNGLPTGSNEWYQTYVKRFRRTDFEAVGRGGNIRRNDIVAYLNFDMFGNPADSIDNKPVLWVCYGINQHVDFANEYSETVNAYVPDIHALTYGRMIFSDHFTFALRRIPAIENLQSDYTSDKYYHTSYDNIDTPDNINYEFAVNVTRGGLAFLLENINMSE